MKKIFIVLIAAALSAAYAANQIVAATQYADGSTNTWTQTDLQDALGLMNRKYWRDMETESGRRSWHGNLMGTYLLTNQTTGVIYAAKLYADGYVHNAGGRKAETLDPEAKAKAAAAARARAEAIKAAWEAANLPPELAAIRSSQRANSGTNEVTVIHTN